MIHDPLASADAQVSKLPLHIILGDCHSGKTELLHRYIHKTFVPTTEGVGIDYVCKNVSFRQQKLQLMIWDTPGQERFKTMTSQYYGRADAAIFVFDCTSEESFAKTVQRCRDFESKSKVGAFKILVASKVDLED